MRAAAAAGGAARAERARAALVANGEKRRHTMLGSLLAVVMLLGAAVVRVAAPVPGPTPSDAGNCGLFGESNAVPPVPGKLMLSCGGDQIVSVLYAVYGQPKGKCNGHDFGSGGSSSFKDTNPQCKGKDVAAKFEALCVGKTSCTAACGSTQEPVPCNDYFGAPGAPADPCPNIPKWAAVVVECPSNWGWWFILLCCLGAGGYVGGFVVHAHKVQGRPLDMSALPHLEFWSEVRSLIEDGVAFAKAKALSKTGAPVGASNPKKGFRTTTESDAAESTELLDNKGDNQTNDYGSTKPGVAGTTKSPTTEASSDSEEGGSLVE